MSKNQELKATQIEQIKENLEKAQSVVFVDYRGLTVEQDTVLRKQLREAGVEYKVLKNTLIKRAVDELQITGLDEHLNGPTAVAFGMNDPASPAKILNDTIKATKKMELKCGLIEKSYIDAKGVESLANLPSREVLLAKMLGSMTAPIANLVYALNAIKESKEQGAA